MRHASHGARVAAHVPGLRNAVGVVPFENSFADEAGMPRPRGAGRRKRRRRTMGTRRSRRRGRRGRRRRRRRSGKAWVMACVTAAIICLMSTKATTAATAATAATNAVAFVVVGIANLLPTVIPFRACVSSDNE